MHDKEYEIKWSDIANLESFQKLLVIYEELWKSWRTANACSILSGVPELITFLLFPCQRLSSQGSEY